MESSASPRRHRIRRNGNRESENPDEHVEIELSDADIYDIYLSFFISILVVHVFALMIIAYYFDSINMVVIFIFLGITDALDILKLAHKIRNLKQ